MREIGGRQGEANASLNLGLLLEAQEDLRRAAELMEVRVDFLRTIGHPDAVKAAAKIKGFLLRLDEKWWDYSSRLSEKTSRNGPRYFLSGDQSVIANTISENTPR